jgi:hypothetical protein
MKKRSEEWCRYYAINPKDISSPDGWQKEFEVSWKEKITAQEFRYRLNLSKVYMSAGIRRALGR